MTDLQAPTPPDAYLIAAAPDLYQALLKMCVAHEMHDVLPEDAFINAYNEAQAAILKARGGLSREGGEYLSGDKDDRPTSN